MTDFELKKYIKLFPFKIKHTLYIYINIHLEYIIFRISFPRFFFRSHRELRSRVFSRISGAQFPSHESTRAGRLSRRFLASLLEGRRASRARNSSTVLSPTVTSSARAAFHSTSFTDKRGNRDDVATQVTGTRLPVAEPSHSH